MMFVRRSTSSKRPFRTENDGVRGVGATLEKQLGDAAATGAALASLLGAASPPSALSPRQPSGQAALSQGPACGPAWAPAALARETLDGALVPDRLGRACVSASF